MDNNRKVVELPLDDVLPNRFQPRIKFNDEPINELASSIKEHGVIQPIVVRTVGDRYEIIAGERRFKAATLAGLPTIPAIITDLNDKDSAEVALIENVQRQDLTPIEEAISYKKILDMGYLTQDDLAQKLGKNQSTIANKLRLLNLDEEVQEALLNGQISERHARSLLKLSNPDDQVRLLNRIITERLTVRKTDEEISNMLNGNNDGQAYNKDIEVLDFEEPIIIPSDDISSFNIPTNPIIEPETGENGEGTQNVLNPFIPTFDNITEETQEEVNVPKFSDLLTPITEEETQLEPSKFFNLLEDDNNIKSENINSGFNFDNIVTQQEEDNNKFDFNNFVIPDTEITNNNFVIPPVEDTTTPEVNNFAMSPNFGIPTIDDSAFNFDFNNVVDPEPQKEEMLETTGNNTYVTGDIKTVVNTIRNCADTIEKYGFTVDTEEFDLEDMYQIIFKVHKK